MCISCSSLDEGPSAVGQNDSVSIMEGEQHEAFEHVGGEFDIEVDDDFVEEMKFPEGTNHVIAVTEDSDNDAIRAWQVAEKQMQLLQQEAEKVQMEVLQEEAFEVYPFVPNTTALKRKRQ